MKNKKTIISLLVILSVVFIGYYLYGYNKTEVLEDKISTKEYQLYPQMNPELLDIQVKNGEITLLDVREDNEWNDGHIDGAVHIRLSDLNNNTTSSISKEKPVYVYCRSGRRAEEGKSTLVGLGFKNVENIGGITHYEERGGKLIK